MAHKTIALTTELREQHAIDVVRISRIQRCPLDLVNGRSSHLQSAGNPNVASRERTIPDLELRSLGGSRAQFFVQGAKSGWQGRVPDVLDGCINFVDAVDVPRG